MSKSRSLALARLIAVESKGSFSSFATERSGDVRTERLAHEYVSGITRWKRWLDYQIDSFYSGDAKGLELKLRVILRLGVYDLLFLSTPDHAVVHEAVELAKKELRAGAGRLVNAIMRSVIRSRESLPVPHHEDKVSYLGITHSHPDWIVRRWLDRFGEIETTRLLEWNNRRPEYSLRSNTLRVTATRFRDILVKSGVKFRDGLTEHFVYVSELSELIRSESFRDGFFSIQDEAAGLVVRTLDPRPGDVVLDLCAAPGGKSMFAAELMANRGRVVALDRHEGRLRMVNESATRLGCTIVETVKDDATKQVSGMQADRVLADVPCSGLGVLAKRADLRWRMSEDRLKGLVDLQSKILQAAASSVRVGGILVYSTCTTEPEENEWQIGSFLSSNSDFERVPALPSDLMDFVELQTGLGDYQSHPQRTGMDGAYAAKLVRRR
ncbi:MAG: 16S rRNA (cytosine(967)-C(5))-methyltransferase RsmB [Rhodothermales bacterium]|nr:16S rRNA (cytosine(967)-C(5))-methyltransferase RsmB [Rhodothermales bacterium]